MVTDYDGEADKAFLTRNAVKGQIYGPKAVTAIDRRMGCVRCERTAVPPIICLQNCDSEKRGWAFL